MHMNASKTKVMSAFVPGGQHQVGLLDDEPLEDADNSQTSVFFFANAHGTEKIRSRINLVRSTFSCLKSRLCLRREILLRTKDRVYEAMLRTILLYGCETWPARVGNERILAVLDNNNIRRIQHVRRRLSSSKEGFVCLVVLQDFSIVK